MVLCAACQVPADLTHKVALALLWCPHVCQTPPLFFFCSFGVKLRFIFDLHHFWLLFPRLLPESSSSCLVISELDFFFGVCACEKWLTPVYGVYATSTEDVYVCVFAPSC